MDTARRINLMTLAATAALLITACSGGNASLSPTGPSNVGGSTSGATIAGHVSSASGVASTLAFAPGGALSVKGSSMQAASGGLTVKVSGTNLSSEVDSAGQFTLTNVPAGTVRLEFVGSGGSATVTVSGVDDGDRIEISVTVNGSSATLQSHMVDMEGTVSGLSGTCPSITFMVHGRPVQTTSATSFSHSTCTSLQNNAVVEVKGQRLADGTLQATSVELGAEGDDAHDGSLDIRGTVSALAGTCPNLTFVVSGKTIVTDGMTRFEGGCALVKNNVKVEVAGTAGTDGRVHAVKVGIDD